MNIDERVQLLAQYEIGWWQAHHRKQKDVFLASMTNLYVLQFGIDEGRALQAVEHRLRAADFHDQAEAFEDAGDQAQAGVYWRKAESALEDHFRLLEADA